MGKQFSIIALIFLGLAGLALVLAGSAARRGETMVIVLLVAALLLWKRSQRIL
jgi:4-hydroxybenzoate polyprenyltransferase